MKILNFEISWFKSKEVCENNERRERKKQEVSSMLAVAGIKSPFIND